MAVILWPATNFAQGDTGRREWLRAFAQAFLELQSAYGDGVPLSAITGLDLDDVPVTSGRLILTYEPGVGIKLGAEADPDSTFIADAEKGQPLGVATLDEDGKLVQALADGGGLGGGHVIVDGAGNVLPQQARLQIIGATLSDSTDAGGTTKVTLASTTTTDYATSADVSDDLNATNLYEIPFRDIDGNGAGGIPLLANRTYRILPTIDYEAATDGDFRVMPTFPAGWIVRGRWEGKIGSAVDSNAAERAPSGLASGAGQTFGGLGIGTPNTLTGDFRVKTNGTPGTLLFRFSKGSPVASQATVLAQSWCDVAQVR